MATLTNPADGGAAFADSNKVYASGNVNPLHKLDPRKYITIDDLLDPNRPDVRDMLVKTYGDQGITVFLKLTGALKNAGTSDEVQYYEEGRRHKLVAGTLADGSNASGSLDCVDSANDPEVGLGIRKNDVIMDSVTGVRYIVTDYQGGSGVTAATAASFDLTTLDGSTFVNQNTSRDFIILGNLYAQGTDQPDSFWDVELVKRLNPFMIIKDRYEVNGSQATNIGYVNVGGGDYRWYIKGEQETRARFMDRREMMMLFAQISGDNGTGGATGITGSEGYFAALEDRGIVMSGLASNPLDSFSELDLLILELDKEGAPNEYAMYLNRKQSLAIDDMLASGIATQVTAGLAGQFGAFNNSPDMAVQLGFKSFTRGGYTFHKHDWKLLNDPTLLGASNQYHGAMIPMTTVSDPVTGTKAPSLEMNYKAANGYSRELEHWRTGGGVMGLDNNGDTGKDVMTMHYRSEINLITRAANQHVALKG